MILRSFSGLACVIAASFTLAACGGAAANAPASSPTTTSASASSLDGKTYEVSLDEAGAPKKDTLVFEGGRFESTLCTSFGFPPKTAYDAERNGDAIAFRVTTRHADGTTVDWKGTVKGDAVEGVAVRTMKGKTESQPFKGALKK